MHKTCGVHLVISFRKTKTQFWEGIVQKGSQTMHYPVETLLFPPTFLWGFLLRQHKCPPNLKCIPLDTAEKEKSMFGQKFPNIGLKPGISRQCLCLSRPSLMFIFRKFQLKCLPNLDLVTWDAAETVKQLLGRIVQKLLSKRTFICRMYISSPQIWSEYFVASN